MTGGVASHPSACPPADDALHPPPRQFHLNGYADSSMRPFKGLEARKPAAGPAELATRWTTVLKAVSRRGGARRVGGGGLDPAALLPHMTRGARAHPPLSNPMSAGGGPAEPGQHLLHEQRAAVPDPHPPPGGAAPLAGLPPPAAGPGRAGPAGRHARADAEVAAAPQRRAGPGRARQVAAAGERQVGGA